MSKSKYKSNYELKFIARMLTGRYMGILIGCVLLQTIISYVAIDIISSLVPDNSTVGYIMNYVVVFIAEVFISVLDVGVTFIYMKSACSMKSSIRDLFFGYEHHLMRALKIGLVLIIINSICMMPVEVATVQFSDIMNNNEFFNSYTVDGLNGIMSGSSDNYELFESYNVFINSTIKYYSIMIVCSVISFILTLSFFPAYYMLLDFPNQNVTQILKKCFEVMHGNKFRLFTLYLGFLPLMLLSAFTCGIALIWVIPYMKMTVTNFYLDLMAVRNKEMANI